MLPLGNDRHPPCAPMVVPTPAAANTAPSEASICGRTAAQPIEFDQPPALLDRRGRRRPQPGVANDAAR